MVEVPSRAHSRRRANALGCAAGVGFLNQLLGKAKPPLGWLPARASAMLKRGGHVTRNAARVRDLGGRRKILLLDLIPRSEVMSLCTLTRTLGRTLGKAVSVSAVGSG